MAWDDPVVWILIAVAIILLFGASRIPQFARSIGQARREFQNAVKGEPPGANTNPATVSSTSKSSIVENSAPSVDQSDPLVVAAQREGIDTRGKTREQIASELSWKLNRK